jgi:hypothetical protein
MISPFKLKHSQTMNNLQVWTISKIISLLRKDPKIQTLMYKIQKKEMVDSIRKILRCVGSTSIIVLKKRKSKATI